MMTRAEYRRSLLGRRAYLAIDLSTTTDMTALVGVFPDDTGFDVLAHFFVPKDKILDRSHRDKVPYDEWARRGFLTATPGNWVNNEALRQEIKDWAAEFDVRFIAYDPWNAHDLIVRLQEQDGFKCVPMRQGFATLSGPTKSLEKAVLSKRLRHDGHPVLRWNIGNVVAETDAAGNIKLSKEKSTERIDGAAALVMAIDVMDRNEAVRKPDYQLFFVGGAR